MCKREDWEITQKLQKISEQEAETAKNLWNANAIAEIELTLNRRGDPLGTLLEIERIISTKPY